MILGGAALSAPASASALTYSHDDGGPELSVGPNIGDGYVALNAFTVTGDYDTVVSLDVWWESNIGVEMITAAVWSDPDQDGDPGDAVLLRSSALTTVPADSGFQTIALTSPIDVGSAGDLFFVGVYYDSDPRVVTVGFDRDYAGPTVSWSVEYRDASADPNDLADAEAQTGAFMIRANAVPTPGAAALLGLVGLGATRRRR